MLKCLQTKIFLGTVGMLCAVMFFSAAALGGHKHEKRGHKGDKGYVGYKYSVPAKYKESCGDCHMAYPACLLPEASWRKILNEANNHFGAELSLDDAGKAWVSDYLLANAADRNGGKIGRKIMRHLDSQTPERISTLPYIQRKHRKIDPAVFSRPAIDGLKNCIACHRDAAKGNFDDDRVSIPQ